MPWTKLVELEDRSYKRHLNKSLLQYLSNLTNEIVMKDTYAIDLPTEKLYIFFGF